MALRSRDITTASTRTRRGTGRRGVTLVGLLAAGALTASVAVPAAHAATTPGIIYGTLDTQTSTVQGVPQIAEFQAYSS